MDPEQINLRMIIADLTVQLYDSRAQVIVLNKQVEAMKAEQRKAMELEKDSGKKGE